MHGKVIGTIDPNLEDADRVLYQQNHHMLIAQAKAMDLCHRTSSQYIHPTNDFGWQIDPVGFRTTLREVYERYQLPIIITENGLGAIDNVEEDGTVRDPYRINYFKQHIEQMQLAITDGVDLLGYCPWSAIDLVSKHSGAKKRYGFVFVDREEFDLKELRRIPKQSYYWYKDVIRSNGENLSNSTEYAFSDRK